MYVVVGWKGLLLSFSWETLPLGAGRGRPGSSAGTEVDKTAEEEKAKGLSPVIFDHRLGPKGGDGILGQRGETYLSKGPAVWGGGGQKIFRGLFYRLLGEKSVFLAPGGDGGVYKLRVKKLQDFAINRGVFSTTYIFRMVFWLPPSHGNIPFVLYLNFFMHRNAYCKQHTYFRLRVSVCE